MPKILTVKEVAEFTRLSIATIYCYVAAKKIPFIKLGARTMFDQAEIINWIEARKISPVSA